MREPTDERVESVALVSCAVEGHQGGRHPGGADQAGAPAISQCGSDFDNVVLAPDGLLEAVNGKGMEHPARQASSRRSARPPPQRPGERVDPWGKVCALLAAIAPPAAKSRSRP